MTNISDEQRARLISYFRSNLSYIDNGDSEQIADDVLELLGGALATGVEPAGKPETEECIVCHRRMLPADFEDDMCFICAGDPDEIDTVDGFPPPRLATPTAPGIYAANGHFVPGRKYETQNGFKADIRYLTNSYLCGHISSAEGFTTLHWSLDGFVLGADPGFDLVNPASLQANEAPGSATQETERE